MFDAVELPELPPELIELLPELLVLDELLPELPVPLELELPDEVPELEVLVLLPTEELVLLFEVDELSGFSVAVSADGTGVETAGVSTGDKVGIGELDGAGVAITVLSKPPFLT